MKKSFLLILASLFAIFALAGCADDSKNDTTPTTPVVTPTPVEPALIKEYAAGFYEITFFYTDGAEMLPISSNCNESSNYGISTTNSCYSATTKGYGQITVDESNNIHLVTKIQMDLSGNGTIMAISPSSQYNYTVYSPIPASNVLMLGNNITINADKAITGVTGRDLSKNTADDAATYSFTFDITNQTITNTMITTTPIEATFVKPTTNVTVVMKKIDALPDGYTMDANVSFPEPAITGFIENPETSTGGGNEENPGGEGEGTEEPTPSPYMNLIGEYNVNSLSLNNGAPQKDAGIGNLNVQNTNLILGLDLNIGMALKVFVYSEDPVTLMENFKTSVNEQGNTVVDFSLGSLATLQMTRTTPYETINTGIGSIQEEISLNINNGENITSETTEFNIVINHPNSENKYYNISFYDNQGISLGLPDGTYVGVGLGGPNSDFTTTRVNTASTSTTYSVDISSLTKTDNAEYVVVVEETDESGANPTGVSTIGLVKLDAIQAQ